MSTDLNKEAVVKQLKDTIAKVIGTQNLMVDGKFIMAYNKLQGLEQKLSGLVYDLEGKGAPAKTE